MKRDAAVKAINAARMGDKDQAKFWMDKMERPEVDTYIGDDNGWQSADGKVTFTDAEMKAHNDQCKTYGIEVMAFDFKQAL